MLEQVDIFVISLDGAIARQESIKKQFHEMSIPFQFFSAVNGKVEDHSLFSSYNEEKRIKIKAEPLSRGQLGCFASHYLLWEKCLDINKPIIILEDDAKIHQAFFSEFLGVLGDLPSEVGCLRLFTNRSKHHHKIRAFPLGSFNVFKFTKGHMRGTGYYLTPAAAKRFIESATEWVLPVDMYMDQFWRNRVECYGVLPPLLSGDSGFESTIGYAPKETKRKRTFRQTLNREIYALRENVRKFWFNCLFLIRHIFRTQR